MPTRSTSCLLLALTLGCASAPERVPPDVSVASPATWTAGDSQGSGPWDSRWWRSFDDGRLDEIVSEALRHNVDVRVAATRVRAAEAAARIVGADVLPQLSGGASASRYRQNIFGIPVPGAGDIITTRQNVFGVSLDATWEIDLWGRFRKDRSAAAADVEASRASLAAVRLSIAAQTAKAYFAAVEAARQVELATQTVASYDAAATSIRRRYEEGVRGPLDLRLSLSALAQARALLERRHLQHDGARRQLEILLGRYPAAAVRASSTLGTVREPVPAGLPSDILIRRPDLVSAERRFAAAESRVSARRRAFFPRIALTGSAGTSSTELENLTDLDFGVWSVAANLTQPLFQGGRLVGALQAAHAAADEALLSYLGSLLRAFGEVETALAAETALADLERHVAEAAAQSEAARRLAERQYSEGLVDYVTLLETQRQSLNAESELITVRRERLDARINLHVALGGGFDAREPWLEFLAVPTPETEARVEQ